MSEKHSPLYGGIVAAQVRKCIETAMGPLYTSGRDPHCCTTILMHPDDFDALESPEFEIYGDTVRAFPSKVTAEGAVQFCIGAWLDPEPGGGGNVFVGD